MEHQYKLSEFQAAAHTFAASMVPAKTAVIVALHGDLGAGKTTFTQSVARAFGVAEDIVSPTFVIQKRYPLEGQQFAQLIHIDAYRLEHADELRVLGWDDIARDPSNIIMLEWPEHVEGLLAESATHIYFSYIDDETRSITYDSKN